MKFDPGVTSLHVAGHAKINSLFTPGVMEVEQDSLLLPDPLIALLCVQAWSSTEDEALPVTLIASQSMEVADPPALQVTASAPLLETMA